MMKGNKLAVYVLLIIMGSVFMEGCASSKACGCGGDLNRAYKTPKRFH